MHKISTFVEQEDALLGVLTVRESVTYALRLQCGPPFSFGTITHARLYSLPLLPRKQVNQRVNRVLSALGLNTCADQRIGTPISRGISGGQKRRVTAACAMVTFPCVLYLIVSYVIGDTNMHPIKTSRRILFLDEVTSGVCANYAVYRGASLIFFIF